MPFNWRKASRPPTPSSQGTNTPKACACRGRRRWMTRMVPRAEQATVMALGRVLADGLDHVGEDHRLARALDDLAVGQRGGAEAVGPAQEVLRVPDALATLGHDEHDAAAGAVLLGERSCDLLGQVGDADGSDLALRHVLLEALPVRVGDEAALAGALDAVDGSRRSGELLVLSVGQQREDGDDLVEGLLVRGAAAPGAC